MENSIVWDFSDREISLIGANDFLKVPNAVANQHGFGEESNYLPSIEQVKSSLEFLAKNGLCSESAIVSGNTGGGAYLTQEGDWFVAWYRASWDQRPTRFIAGRFKLN